MPDTSNVQTLDAFALSDHVTASISVASNVKSLAVISIPTPPVAFVSSDISSFVSVISCPDNVR